MDDKLQPAIFNTHIGNFSVFYRNRPEFLQIKKEIFTEKCYQPIKNITNDKPLIIDIGSHIGLSVMYFKEKLPTANICAYEPVSQLFDLLEMNILSNNLQNITMVNAAVTNLSGKIQLNLSDDDELWFSNSSIYEGSWSGRVHTKEIEVDSISIKEVINEYQRIDILKIDIEGYELKLLELIDHTKVDQLMVEYHPINKNRFKNIRKVIVNQYSKIKYHINGSISDYAPSGDKLFIIHASK